MARKNEDRETGGWEDREKGRNGESVKRRGGDFRLK